LTRASQFFFPYLITFCFCFSFFKLLLLLNKFIFSFFSSPKKEFTIFLQKKGGFNYYQSNWGWQYNMVS
jgi:hypothetical protein